MIRVAIEIDDNGTCNVRSDAPPQVALGVVHAAYVTLLTQVIRADVVAHRKIELADGPIPPWSHEVTG